MYVPFSVALYCQLAADCVPLFWFMVSDGAVIFCPSQIAAGAEIVFIVGGRITVIVALPFMLPETLLQCASSSLVIWYVVLEDGLTDIVAEVPDDNVLSEESPVILYLKGAVPVKLIVRLALLPLQMLVVPLIVAFRTFKVAEAEYDDPVFVAVYVVDAAVGVTV